jgi:hypothetical protein
MPECNDAIGYLAAIVAAALGGDLAAARARSADLEALLAAKWPGARGVGGGLRAELRFDPVGLAEIAAMTGETAQNINYLMGASTSPPPPRPVQLARMKVWRRSEVVVWWSSIGREVFWTDTPEPREEESDG